MAREEANPLADELLDVFLKGFYIPVYVIALDNGTTLTIYDAHLCYINKNPSASVPRL